MSVTHLMTRHVRASVATLRRDAGVALPMALLCLVLLSTLIVGFAVLSAIEPTIAGNQLAAAQARALAEAGVERALWALSNPTLADGIPATFTAAPSPYDGGQFVPVTAGSSTVGGFRVTVTNGAAPYERRITAVGVVPGEATSGRKAVQRIAVTAINPQLIAKDPPAAVSVRGRLRAGDNVRVDARSDESCGAKVGTLTQGETAIAGSTLDVRGAGGDASMRNRVLDAAGGAPAAGSADIVTNTSGAVFDAFALSDVDLQALRTLAKARGTYVQGAVRYGAGQRLPNGLVFVDAPDDTPGAPSVIVDAGAPADASGEWSGWLIVNGSIAVGGDARLRGLVYAQGTITAAAAGPAGVSGAIVSRDVRDLASSAIEATAGQLTIAYNCADTRTGGGTIPGRWTVKGGGYREVSGS